MTNVIEGWTVFDHPTDYPNECVARRWIARRDGSVEQTNDIFRSVSLNQLREVLQAEYPHLIPVPRMMRDDPTIVEVWL